MNKRDITKLVLAAALVAALPACDDSAAPPPKLAPPAQQPAAQQQPAEQPVKLAAEDLEGSALADSSVPFILKIETETVSSGSSPDGSDGGKLIITAYISAHHAVKAPTSISIEVPKGTSLAKGQVEEKLAFLPGGETTRVFEIDLGANGKLAADAPVRVKVSLRDPKGGFGAYAERVYPEKVATPAKKSSRVPKPPVARPGAPLVH